MQITAYLFNVTVTALILGGQAYLYYRARPHLGKVGRALFAALQLGAVAIAWVNGEGWSWGPVTPLTRGISFAAAIWISGSAGAALILLAAQRLGRRRPFSPERRKLLSGAAGAVALAPFRLAGYVTLLVRRGFDLREATFAVPGLPPDLEGLRLTLLSDIHLGPYLSLPELDRVIAMANETRPHVALVTGDLITRHGDPLESCLSRLSTLRAEAGVFGCLGNHEVYANCQDFTEARGRELGMDFLRLRRRLLRFGAARLNLAGVDYQRQRRPYLAGAGRLLEPGAVNLLMSHNPDVFPKAADLGYDLVVGGHTHGGQVTVEILEQTMNVVRFFTPYVAGIYRLRAASLYVSRGIGTINLPMRLGARPEVSLLRLRRA